MIQNLTDEQIEQLLNMLETMICREQDTKTLAVLNHTFQQLIDEQVRREIGGDE
jgi:hypothetical protein